MKIFSGSFWAGRFENIRLTVQRFPLPVLCCLAFAALTLLRNHSFRFLAKSVDLDIHLWVFVCGFFLLGGLRLMAESRNWSDARYFAVGIPVFAVLWTHLFFADSLLGVLPFLFPALLLFVVVAPYIGAPGDEKSFWYFNYQLWWQAGFGGAVAVVLCAGISAILATLDYLFGIDMPSKLYNDVWILGFSVFWPLLALSGVPRQFVYKDECVYPPPMRFTVTWILVPLIAIYLLILYAYAAKIALIWELPKGKLGYMISGFGAAGIATYLIAFPLRDRAQGLTRLFFKYFYADLLLPVGLLLLAIFVRINEQGLTENRYAVVLIALWFLTMSGWFIARKNRVHIKYNPMILAVLGLLASFGPWSAAVLSTASQLGRLENILVRHAMFADGKIIAAKSHDVPFDDMKTVSSIVDYFVESGKMEALSPWLSGLVVDDKSTAQMLEDTHRRGAYIEAPKIVSSMGLVYVSRWTGEQESADFGIYSDFDSAEDLENIAGFVYRLRFSTPRLANTHPGFSKDAGPFNLSFGENRLKVSVPATGDTVIFDLAWAAQALRNEGQINGHVPESLRHLMVLEDAQGKLHARVYLKEIQGSLKDDNPHINSIRAEIFLSAD